MAANSLIGYGALTEGKGTRETLLMYHVSNMFFLSVRIEHGTRGFRILTHLAQPTELDLLGSNMCFYKVLLYLQN